MLRMGRASLIQKAAPGIIAPRGAVAGDSSVVSGGAFTLAQRPFSASSSWNTPIPAGRTYTPLAWPASNGYYYGVSWDAYSAAIYISQATDPLVAVTCPASWGWPANQSVRMPVGATGSPDLDGELLVIDLSTNTVHNWWVFNRTSDTTATASAYGACGLWSSGWGTASPFKGAGILAAGCSMLPGILVEAYTDVGEIEHAIAIAVYFNLCKSGFVGEAIATDGSSSTGIVQEGQRLGIPPSQSMPSGMSVLGQKIFRALQNYGAFVIDVTGWQGAAMRAQQNAYSSAIIDPLFADLEKTMPLLQSFV